MRGRVVGPVPSSREDRSLGVDKIPHKVCSYSCLYCQVGRAIKMQADRQEFYSPEELFREAKELLDKVQNEEEYQDYITIVPDGEPTLDIHLGMLIQQLQSLKVPVAVITNASLIHLPDVQNDLLMADYVSVKADAFSPETWKNINRPGKGLTIHQIADGILAFREKFSGKMVTETMLVKGINDSPTDLARTARILERIKPDAAYLAIPTRPPAFENVEPSGGARVNEAYHIFKEHIENVELLTGYEGKAFASTGNFRDDLLSITAVHPMREDAVLKLLEKTGSNQDLLKTLLQERWVEKSAFRGHTYYLRRFSRE